MQRKHQSDASKDASAGDVFNEAINEVTVSIADL
jgi:hypothetical protein